MVDVSADLLLKVGSKFREIADLLATVTLPSPPPPPPPDLSKPKVMPTDIPQGWELVVSDDFEGGAVDLSKWDIYGDDVTDDPKFDGQWTSTNKTGLWRGDAVSIETESDGTKCLVITPRKRSDGKLITGAVTLSKAPGSVRKFGRYEFCSSMEPGDGFNIADLYWSDKSLWCLGGEIDMREMVDALRMRFKFFSHFGAKIAGEDTSKVSRTVEGFDLTKPLVYGFEWMPDHESLDINGRLAYRIDSTSGTNNSDQTRWIPDKDPMRIVHQGEVAPFNGMKFTGVFPKTRYYWVRLFKPVGML